MNKRTSVESLFKKEEILYKLARLVRNTDCINPSTWGVKCGHLLMELRIIDGEKYDKLVLGKESSNAIIHNMIDKIQDAIGEENEAT